MAGLRNQLASLLKLIPGNEKRGGMSIEQLTRSVIDARVARQRQVMRCIAAGTIEAESLDRLGYSVGDRQRIAQQTAGFFLDTPNQALLHLPQGADESSRVAPIERDGVKATTAKMLAKPFKPLVSAKLGALFDTPTIGDHDGQRYTAILGTPPARNPVAAALFLCCTIG